MVRAPSLTNARKHWTAPTAARGGSSLLPPRPLMGAVTTRAPTTATASATMEGLVRTTPSVHSVPTAWIVAVEGGVAPGSGRLWRLRRRLRRGRRRHRLERGSGATTRARRATMACVTTGEGSLKLTRARSDRIAPIVDAANAGSASAPTVHRQRRCHAFPVRIRIFRRPHFARMRLLRPAPLRTLKKELPRAAAAPRRWSWH